MSKHTHRGHCQICLRVQAIDTATGLVALHGYNVVHGYFNGTCPGSNLASLHISREHTNSLIERCNKDAIQFALRAVEFQDGSRVPQMARSGEYEKVTKQSAITGKPYTANVEKLVPFAEAAEMYQAQALRQAVWDSQNKMRAAQDYAKMLTEWANKITGKVEAYRVEDLDVGAWKQGDVVRIGGKSGFDAVIEAIEDRSYTTRGFRRGSETIMCPHARVTRPQRFERRSRTGIITHEAREAKTYWEPLRHIKRPKSPLIEQLKKAGLL
jgi:hypothetical protein